MCLVIDRLVIGDHLYAGAMELATDIGIKHVPFLMLIDEKGVVRWIKEGEMDETNFRDILGKFGRGETVTQLPSAKTPTASSFGEPA